MARTLLPPRWVITTVWSGHRTLHRASAGRLGLRAPRPDLAGMLRLRAVGRTSGRERAVILCYVEEGSAFVTLAMNGWDAAEPQWWRNLQAQPEALVETVDGTVAVRGRAADAEEQARLWDRIRGVRGWATDLDAMAALRGRPTTVVVLERRPA
ncbi:nitroreductase/quinone reductase family protein [Oryzobacter telluris]|uniref:nitroreductase/quinone reductase family protein n=1 Tax=Oryzobacter telluris TaxID=3149179 RepID=UPI00370D4272